MTKILMSMAKLAVTTIARMAVKIILIRFVRAIVTVMATVTTICDGEDRDGDCDDDLRGRFWTAIALMS